MATGLLLAVAAFAIAAGAAETPPAPGPAVETLQAFDRYIRLTEARLGAWATAPERRGRLKEGAILCQPRNHTGELRVSRGLIHDWVGAVFIPNVRLGDALALVRDYNRHAATYRPEVISSRILQHSGDDFVVAMRLLKRKGITVVLDTEHQIHYQRLSEQLWQSRSRAVRIAEVQNPGSPRERSLPPGRDHGFLWRLHSYWRFQEADGGVYVECQAVSLSRAVPPALGWLLDPIVRKLPRESLVNTLRATRAALAPASTKR
ncbi:MAG: hypothetical protein NTY38_02505 [Acidobacteria bacterium]|nr:hypothetical protein [Acidobacteriota bacterium]